MRRSLWAILTAVLVAIGVPNAHADSPGVYTVTFTCIDACVTPLTAPDVSFPSPTVQASLGGYEFSSPFTSDWSPTNQYVWQAGRVNRTSDGVTYDSGIIIPLSALAEFRQSDMPECKTAPAITPVPEQSSGILALSGIGLVFVMRNYRRTYSHNSK